MAPIHVVTDSGCDLSANLIEELGLEVIPLVVHIDGRTYRHNVDITAEEFLGLLEENPRRVKVSPPDPLTFRETYARVTGGTDQILSIYTSAHLGRVVRAAQRAARGYRGRYQVEVLDSQSVSAGLGVLAQAALELTKESQDLGEVVRRLRGMIPNLYHAFFAKGLDENARRQMADRTQMSLETISEGDLLLSLEEGDFVPLETVVDEGEAVDRLEEFAEEFPSVQKIFILEGVDPTLANQLEDAVSDLFPEKEITRSYYGPFLASWLGSRGVGLVIYEEQ